MAAPAGSARAYSDEQVEWLLGQIELIGKLKESDNRKLLWLGMNTKAWKALDVGGVEAEIFGEIENRLYPEYDGETVTFEEWGWKTLTGEIRYLPNDEVSEAGPLAQLKHALTGSTIMRDDKSIFYAGRRDDLRRNGYIESAAEPDFFAALLDEMKRGNPEAECVTQVGQGSIHQIIFLPKRRKEIVRRLKDELQEYEQDAANTRKALAYLSNEKGQP